MRLQAFLLTALLVALPPAAHAQQSKQNIPQLQAVARADSNDPVAHYDLARAYLEKKEWDEAESELREAVALAPQYGDAYLALGLIPEYRGEKYFKDLIKKRGESAADSVALESMAYQRRAYLLNPLLDLSVLPRAPEVPTLSINGRSYRVPWAWNMAKGVNAIRQEKYPDALKRFAEAMGDSGTIYRFFAPDAAFFYHAMAAARMQQYAVAVEDLWLLVQRRVEREEQRLGFSMATNDYRYMLATMLFLDGRFDQAIPVFKRTLEFDVGLYQSHVQLARMHEAREEWDEAVQERQAAIMSNPDDATLLVDLAATLIRVGRLPDAITPLEQATRQTPRDPRSFYLLGIAHARNGNLEASREALRQFLAIAPSRYAEQIAEVKEELRER